MIYQVRRATHLTLPRTGAKTIFRIFSTRMSGLHQGDNANDVVALALINPCIIAEFCAIKFTQLFSAPIVIRWITHFGDTSSSALGSSLTPTWRQWRHPWTRPGRAWSQPTFRRHVQHSHANSARSWQLPGGSLKNESQTHASVNFIMKSLIILCILKCVAQWKCILIVFLCLNLSA